jgi:hypothetical protein
MAAMIKGDTGVGPRERRDLLPPAQVIPTAGMGENYNRSLSMVWFRWACVTMA